MASIRSLGDSNSAVLQQDHNISPSSKILESVWIQGNISPSFQVDAMKEGSLLEHVVKAEDFDGEGFYLLHPQSKKRRLGADQVEVLERNFENENKLDPGRKLELARSLGLHPRQVAIWFQNRRARFKTKQLEKDCSSLRASYEKLKGEYDIVMKENENLKNQLWRLKEKLHARVEASCNMEEPREIIPSEKNISIENRRLAPKACLNKPEDVMSTGQSDVLDSDNPWMGRAEPSNDDQSDEEGEQDNMLEKMCWFSQPNGYDVVFSIDEETFWPALY